MATIALIQMNSTDRVADNFSTALRLIDHAIAKKAGLIVLPEHFLYIGPDKSTTFDFESAEIAHLKQIARSAGVCICAGSFFEPRPEGGHPYNTSLFIDQTGTITGIYRKIHLFDVAVHDSAECNESSCTSPGTAISAVNTPFAMIGMTICYDLRFPELYRYLALSGCELILVPSNFAMMTGKDHWQVLLQARAIENGVYIAAPDQIGAKYDGNRSYGRSMVIDPWGTVTAQAPDDEESVVLAAFDRNRVDAVRATIPSLNHIRLFDRTFRQTP